MIIRNGILYRRVSCERPDHANSCAGCDLYRPEGRAGHSRCGKGPGMPVCHGRGRWWVFKRVEKPLDKSVRSLRK
jgi:hypothetical protein